MKFNKYSKIENHYREKYIHYLQELGFDKLQYQITEKIDGANFQFITDGNNVRVASRNNVVDGGFYNCESVIQQYSKNVKELKKKYFLNSQQVSIYGELYGNTIQKRIDYGVDIQFIGFDISVDGMLISPLETERVLNLMQIPVVSTLEVTDKLDKALEYNNKFKSKIYPDANDTNITEGIVIKPVEPLYLPNGSRVIIKSKNEKFSEKKKKNNNKQQNPFNALAEQYITENRVNSVLSKFGYAKPEDFGTIIKLLSEDAIEDMISDGDIPGNYNNTSEYKLIRKAVSSKAAEFLRKNLLHKL